MALETIGSNPIIHPTNSRLRLNLWRSFEYKPQFNIGVSSSGKTQHFDCCIRRFESCHPSQKSTGFDLSIFYPLRKQWYIITRKRASHHRRCISSAAGCISFRNDDIQNFVLMICNSCGIDDIHGFRRDLCKSSNSYSIMPKISFSVIFAFSPHKSHGFVGWKGELYCFAVIWCYASWYCP